ncbi:hypothetical protein yc1106_03545 [Curvularia clavata]|uniref:Uncharacterized protein n=1 Tax=Curvularia clavata TaxID=95742 RepID=A0A9Q8Z4Q9_CURCL|nr:hypothetical protein yc1106_03545 [Curvularia clavata]
MARINCLVPLASFLFVLLSKVDGGFSRPLNGNFEWDIDFNTLLEGDLGATPAVWLTSQSIVVELKAREDRDHGLRPVGQDVNGGEAGSYLASLLVTPSDSIDVTHGHETNNSAIAGDICRSLVNLPKVTGKPMIDLETLQNRVLKSILGNGFVLESTRNLCKNLVPGIEAAWEQNKCPWRDARIKIAMNSSFQKVLSAHLTDLGIGEARALRFAGELEATLRLVDSTSSLEGAFENLVRELMSNISTLVLRGSAEQSAVPSLREFTKLSDNAARRLPQGPIPVGTSQLRDADNPICIIGTFTEIAMSSLRIAADLGGRMEVAANSATSVMDHLHAATLACRSGFLETMASKNAELRRNSTTELRNAAQVMRERVDKLPLAFRKC